MTFDLPRVYETAGKKGVTFTPSANQVSLGPRFRGAKGSATLSHVIVELDDGTTVVTELRMARDGKIRARTIGSDDDAGDEE